MIKVFEVNDTVRYAGKPGVITQKYTPAELQKIYYQFSYIDNNGIIHQIDIEDERALTHA